MKKILLNDNLKIYYSESLEESIESDNEFWDLDEGIKNHLISINNSKNVRTIYSKKGKDLANFRFESYLRIGYTEKIEQELFNKIIPLFFNKYNLSTSEFSLEVIEPHKQSERTKTKENNGMRCITDSNYFNITQLMFKLKSKNNNIQDEFWNELNNTLSVL